MFDWLSSLWSTDGFVARKDCGGWTPEWITLHTLSDVLIWLAYLSIPLVLLAVARHRAVRPLRPMLWLFAAFIVSCGTVHLIEAVIFEHPVYRLSGVVKGVTAVVSWATVFALVPALRTVLPLLDKLPASPAPKPPPADPTADRSRPLVYAMAVLVGLLAVLVRYALDPLLGTLPAHGLSILAVIFIGWYGGFGPGLVTLLLSGTLNVYLFVPDRDSLVVNGLNHQVDVGVYLVTGLGVLLLGEMQRRTRRRLHAKMTQLRAVSAALAVEKLATDRALAQLDALVRNAPYSIAFLDHDLRPVLVNEVFARTTRIAVEDHYGRRLPDLFPDIPSDLLTKYQEVLAGAPPVVGRLVVGDGRVWEVSAFRVPLDDTHGGLGIIGQDVTERQAAERQVREAASQLAQLTEGVPLLMWACSPTGECDYLSRQWLDYTGRGLVEQLDYGWMDAVHPDDRDPTSEAWAKAVEAGGGFEVEYRLRRADGVYRWFAVRGIPLRDQTGTVVRWFGSCTDVDDRVLQGDLLGRLVEERTLALKEQKIFLNAILDNVAEGIVACDADGKLQLFNAATRRIHGLPADPLPSDQWAEHYQLFEADGTTPMPTERVPLRRAWRGEVVQDAELVVKAAGQPERYLQCFGQQLRGEDGRVFGAVVSMRDVTVRREYERELVRTADALRVSNLELEKFAYIASHDLQEPLRKIQAFGTRLADKYKEEVGEQGKDYITRMLDSAGRMRRLIEDLLAFSRVTTKAAEFVPVDLNAVARDVLSDLEERVARSGGRVELGELPTLPGDTSQLRQVFQNLIGNALKFAKPDTPPVVRVAAVAFDRLPADAPPPPPPAAAGWRITVADNGIGFDPQYADRIFELFQRLHGRTEYEGTGLGLAIVRKIVVRHGAAVSAHSHPGGGATFVIDWPAATL